MGVWCSINEGPIGVELIRKVVNVIMMMSFIS